MPSRDDLASAYLDQLQHDPYPVQEEALLAWFSTEQGVLVCAPTGMGKTLVAEAALFEALHTGQTAYYTTPLIALTDQKFQEVQDAAVRWGFEPEDVGLVTGNRKVNPDARVLVVVAEILLNRLLDPEAFDFADVSAVVMDEFHSFNDPERGIVWELSLALLPRHVRLMLLSATVGNTNDFLIWLHKSHSRRLDLVQSVDRRVPLRYHWVSDQLLNEQLTLMASGDEETRRTPALVFCFNREECWRVAEQLKGKALLGEGQQKQLAEELKQHDWSLGAGPKLKTILQRGIGVHHAGVLPRYKRIVEDLFQRKLLTVCVCTETLAAGMNLPARSVLLTALLTGPPTRKKLIDASVAHQIFGRAGRPQYDTEGHVFALAHEDDVKIQRYVQKMEQIPEDTKDPQLIRKRKQLKKKMPTRRKTVQYWDEKHFQRLIDAPPRNLSSQGQIPWRLLAYLLRISPSVAIVRETISRRLMDSRQIDASRRNLVRMLLTLEAAGFVTLEPEPTPGIRASLHGDSGADAPAAVVETEAVLDRIRNAAAAGAFTDEPATDSNRAADSTPDTEQNDGAFGDGIETGGDDSEGASHDIEPSTEIGAAGEGKADDATAPAESRGETPPGSPTTPASAEPKSERPTQLSTSLKRLLEAQGVELSSVAGGESAEQTREPNVAPEESYTPDRAFQTEQLADLLTFKSVNPILGTFLVGVLPFADSAERVQALESVLEFPGSLVRELRIPNADFLPPSPFTRNFLHPELLTRGLASASELGDLSPDFWDLPPEERVWPLTFPEKLLRLYYAEYPGAANVRIMPVWAAGELLHFGGDFNKLVTSRNLVRQEGVVFRHVLRVILLCDEFVQHLPQDSDWRTELLDITQQLTESCRRIDPRTTDKMIESAHEPDAISALAASSNKPA